MWPAALTRLLKRRLIYIVLLLILLIYTVTKVFHKRSNLHLLESNDFTVERTRPLIWRTFEEHVLPDELDYRTNAPDVTCQNTIQGKFLITDDRGFVCNADHMLSNGCCNVEKPSTQYYTCETCDNSTYCCGIYEYCVSCCLHPEKRPILELALEVIKGRQAMLYAQVNDQFELCVAKCRTNSHSVEHENRYRDIEHRFCYGPTQAHESQIEVSGMGS
ncbi:SREBP regulating gene protein [Cochliomyia hominivorax]